MYLVIQNMKNILFAIMNIALKYIQKVYIFLNAIKHPVIMFFKILIIINKFLNVKYVPRILFSLLCTNNYNIDFL